MPSYENASYREKKGDCGSFHIGLIIQMDHVKRKRAFEHVQNVRIRIILRMRKVLSRHLLSINTFYLSIVSNGCAKRQLEISLRIHVFTALPRKLSQPNGKFGYVCE